MKGSAQVGRKTELPLMFETHDQLLAHAAVHAARKPFSVFPTVGRDLNVSV